MPLTPLRLYVASSTSLCTTSQAVCTVSRIAIHYTNMEDALPSYTRHRVMHASGRGVVLRMS